MVRDDILEYPYNGFITRTVDAERCYEDDSQIVIYNGVMDEHMAVDDEGHTLQTSSYIISIPLTRNESNEWIVPRKGDEISLQRYGETLEFVVDNAEPSQLGGVSIYATRKIWQ